MLKLVDPPAKSLKASFVEAILGHKWFSAPGNIVELAR